MTIRRTVRVSPRLAKLVAAVLVGLSIGTLVPPEPVALPLVGTVPGVLVGGGGLLAGVALYRRGPALLGADGCGCAGECGCS